jgi:hypothetical protein
MQGTTISRVALAHWTRIKRLELQSAPASTSSLSPAQLERKALVFLITADWLQAEARAEGIDLPSSGVEATYRHLVNGPSGQSFASGLRSRGIARADELLVLTLQELSNKLRAKVGAGHDRLKAFVAAFRHRWKQRTSCRPGYIVPECRNGPALPSSPN